MTEEAVRGAEAEPASEETAGRLLRQARETSGVHIAALAVALKVPVGKLEALEADRYGDLPDTVFTRALASSVCRVLKVDAVPVLEKLPQGQRPRLEARGGGLNASFKDTHSKTTVALGVEGGSRKVRFAVMALLAAAVVVYLLPHDAIDSLRKAVSAGGAAPVAELPARQAVEVVNAAVPVPEALVAAQPSPQQTAEAAASEEAGGLAAPPPLAVATPAPSETKPVAAALGEGILEFRATDESWVQVRDASGSVIFQRSLAAGEAAVAPGRPPLSVVVGKANATKVFVRGTPFDLAAVARENVARFEVK